MAEQKFLGEAGLDVLTNEVKIIKNNIGISPFEEWRYHTRKLLGTYVNVRVSRPNPSLQQKNLEIFHKILDNFMVSWDRMCLTIFIDYNDENTRSIIARTREFASAAYIGDIDVLEANMSDCLSDFDSIWDRPAYLRTSYNIRVREDLETYDHVSWYRTILI